MSDNKQSQDGRDRSRVDINDPSEVEYLHQQYPQLQHQQVVDAIKAHGPSREAITRFLDQQKGR